MRRSCCWQDFCCRLVDLLVQYCSLTRDPKRSHNSCVVLFPITLILVISVWCILLVALAKNKYSSDLTTGHLVGHSWGNPLISGGTCGPSNSLDLSIRVIDLETRLETVAPLKGHEGYLVTIICKNFLHGNDSMPSYSSLFFITLLYNASTIQFQHDVSYCEQTKTLASASEDGTVKLWDLRVSRKEAQGKWFLR